MFSGKVLSGKTFSAKAGTNRFERTARIARPGAVIATSAPAPMARGDAVQPKTRVRALSVAVMISSISSLVAISAGE